MDMKPATFTLDVKGLTLPDSVREEISLALNATLMRKLGEVNLTGHAADAADAAAQQAPGSTPLFGKVVRIDGGEIIRFINRGELSNSLQKSLANAAVVSVGFEPAGRLQQFAG